MADDFSFGIDLTPPDRRARLVAAAYAAASWVRARRAVWGESDAAPSPAPAAPPAATPRPVAAPKTAAASSRGIWTGRER